MKKPAAALVIFCFIAAPCFAADYKPGTVGYLYDNCREALKNGASPGVFIATYCGGFLEGYSAGAMVSNWIILAPSNPADPCAAQKNKEYDRIGHRMCANLPDYSTKMPTPGVMLRTGSDIAARWGEFLKRKNRPALKAPLAKEINGIIKPGAFCNSLNKAEASRETFTINPALLKAGWQNYVFDKYQVKLTDKYTECKTALANPGSFTASRCSAEITGFLTGILSTQGLQKRKPVKGGCAKEIDRLYDDLDFSKRLCVNDKTGALSVAKIFLQKENSPQSANTPAYGAAGYLPVYSGAMCR